MADKALTVAIAGALAAPMAAQAVDFSISGHVNRALFITDMDGDGGTKAEVANNGSSSTRVRANGSSELMDGNTVSIQFEYEEGGAYDGGGTGLKLRHANVQYGGGFGKITIGQGSEAGDSSAYSDTSGVFGIGHGQDKGSSSLGGYFGSLDAGGRVNMVRYDTPSLGPISAAVSVGNEDKVSGLLQLSSEFGGTSFGAKLATHQKPKDESIIGASFGATMASGLTLSAAWAKGKEQGRKDPTDPTVELVVKCPDPTAGQTCLPAGDGFVLHTDKKDATPGTDPSYLQAAIGYKFGNSAVAVSWYKSDDFVAKGSEGTALGIGAKHTLPKVGAELYTAVQNYDVKKTAGGASMDETVFVVGTRVKF